MNPFKAMLKFRFPYTAGKTEYLDGDIYLPVWGKNKKINKIKSKKNKIKK